MRHDQAALEFIDSDAQHQIFFWRFPVPAGPSLCARGSTQPRLLGRWDRAPRRRIGGSNACEQGECEGRCPKQAGRRERGVLLRAHLVLGVNVVSSIWRSGRTKLASHRWARRPRRFSTVSYRQASVFWHEVNSW